MNNRTGELCYDAEYFFFLSAHSDPIVHGVTKYVSIYVYVYVGIKLMARKFYQ